MIAAVSAAVATWPLPASRRYTAEILRDVGLLTLAVWLVWFPVSRLALDQVVDPEDPSDETDGYEMNRNETFEEFSR